MNSLFNATLKLVSKWAFNTAINSVSAVSTKGMYQPKEPKVLLNYVKKLNEK